MSANDGNPFARAPEDMRPHNCVHAYDQCSNEGCAHDIVVCDAGGCERAKDVLRREGYMLALERVRGLRLHDHERCLTPDEVHVLDIAATRVARSAPGEVE